jgi:hypothetical protein
MTISLQAINIGDYANDGTGDDLRTAFAKVNLNFSTLEGDIANLFDDKNPKLGGDLDLNGFKIKGNTPIRLQAGQVIVSGTIEASQFVGQISDLSNHKLDDLNDVIVPDPFDLIEGQALVYDGMGSWVPGNIVPPDTVEVDGGSANTIFNLDEGAIIDAGNA